MDTFVNQHWEYPWIHLQQFPNTFILTSSNIFCLEILLLTKDSLSKKNTTKNRVLILKIPMIYSFRISMTNLPTNLGRAFSHLSREIFPNILRERKKIISSHSLELNKMSILFVIKIIRNLLVHFNSKALLISIWKNKEKPMPKMKIQV